MPVRAVLLFLSLLGAPAFAAADLTLVRVTSGWRDAASFKRISEYFTGRENTGGETVLRTHPDRRDGYYFLLRVRNADAPRRITARLQIIADTSAQTRDFTFTPDLRAGDTVLHLGLTGPDWPDADADPVAWKLELLDADGRLLAGEKSYLWEKPDGR